MNTRKVIWATVVVGVLAGCVGISTSAVAAPKARTATTTTTTTTTTPSTPTRLPVSQLKIMNYYPADAGWTLMWSTYSHARTAADFASIASLGANTVRIIVQPNTLGYPTVSPTMLATFRDVLATAQATGLSVQLTLFDWWSNYADVAGSESWLRSLLGGQANNPTIALVELQNELPVTNSAAISWAQTLLPYLTNVLPGVPRTVSASGSTGLAGITTLLNSLTPSMMDVADVHYYGDASGAGDAIRAAQSSAGGRPVILGETGLSTPDGAAGEEAQARFYRVIARTTKSFGMPPAAPWTLTDFTSTAIPNNPGVNEYHYGLRRLDGTWKPAAAVVQAAYAGQVDNDLDGGFEREVNMNGARLGAWTPFDAADGLGTPATDLVRTGAHSLCFAATVSRPGAVPAVLQKLPVLTAGQTFSVSTYVNRVAPTGGERIALAWFDNAGHYLSQNESNYANTAGTWQPLQVTANAPAGATTVQVNLKAGNESGRACFDDTSINW